MAKSKQFTPILWKLVLALLSREDDLDLDLDLDTERLDLLEKLLDSVRKSLLMVVCSKGRFCCWVLPM